MGNPSNDVLFELARAQRLDAPVATVWQLVSDPMRHPEWSDELQKTWWLDGSRGEGARFVGRNRIEAFGDWITEPLEWETTSTVVVAEDLHRFCWLVGSDDTADAIARWGFELQEDGDGTLLRHEVQIFARGLARTMGQNPDEGQAIIDERRAALGEVLEVALRRISASTSGATQLRPDPPHPPG